MGLGCKWHQTECTRLSARGETLGQGAKGRKGETKYLQQLLQVFIFFQKRLNARLDEAHLLIPSKKVLQKIQC